MVKQKASGARDVEAALKRTGSPERAQAVARFFKTGPGEYGEGDRFLGVTVPQVRAIVRAFLPMSEDDTVVLLQSPFHECRLAALIALTRAYQSAPPDQKRHIARTYLSHKKWINNWDLVDASAYHIYGAELVRTRSRVPDSLMKSTSVWDRRIAMVSTYAFIKSGDPSEAFRAAHALMTDEHDLIHKASGWMLREAGKQDMAGLRKFLDAHAHRMPRTMLRYAIERMGAAERGRYMKSVASPKTRAGRKIS
jgi:3-methyladenine DNA glycosylase AlkD